MNVPEQDPDFFFQPLLLSFFLSLYFLSASAARRGFFLLSY